MFNPYAIVYMNSLLLQKILSMRYMKTEKRALSLIFLLIGSIVYAQDIKSNQEFMSTIINDPEHYYYATADAESYDLAVQKAVDRLATQISTKVENTGTITIYNDDHDG